MMIVGYCQKCRRIKNVRITRPQPRQVQVGTCSACQQKEDDRVSGRTTERR